MHMFLFIYCFFIILVSTVKFKIMIKLQSCHCGVLSNRDPDAVPTSSNEAYRVVKLAAAEDAIYEYV